MFSHAANPRLPGSCGHLVREEMSSASKLLDFFLSGNSPLGSPALTSSEAGGMGQGRESAGEAVALLPPTCQWALLFGRMSVQVTSLPKNESRGN